MTGIQQLLVLSVVLLSFGNLKYSNKGTQSGWNCSFHRLWKQNTSESSAECKNNL